MGVALRPRQRDLPQLAPEEVAIEVHEPTAVGAHDLEVDDWVLQVAPQR
jgi:hypothetical protein